MYANARGLGMACMTRRTAPDPTLHPALPSTRRALSLLRLFGLGYFSVDDALFFAVVFDGLREPRVRVREFQ